MAKSKYYLFLDECGDQNLANFDINFPIFTLCGIIVEADKLTHLNQQIDDIKLRYWGHKNVILHSRDIRKCEKGFEILFDNELKQKFYEDINQVLGQTGIYVIIACSILKEPYIRKHGRLQDVYAQSLSFVLERSIFYLDSVNNGEGIDAHIIAEQRGKKEDKNLNEFYNELIDRGTYWVTSLRFKEYFTRFEFKPKKYNINGLQVADLIAYPITRHILNPESTNPSFAIIEGNIYREGDKMLGLKIVP